MHTPRKMQMKDREDITQFISAYSFGLLVSPSLTGTHLPLVLNPDEGEHGTLYGHISKANSHWKELDNQRVLVVFTGPHAYISPTWYESEQAVPTWNYTAVHCYGVTKFLNNLETQSALEDLVNKYEPGLMNNTELMPEEYVNKQRQAIVGFKIVITEIHAKEKLGQHKNQGDQKGVFTALSKSKMPDNKELADYMEKHNIGTGK
ncbi:FMN-binding negative transcriptional regulator [Xenorhabdus innexi]|uniref:Transcriptional regulator n=1 Tax=Xenorhabdus innexi TaxID=290109 RepID=A0A1N6MY18_9GAMM|nr:FMN-binding negative transcriptional regulator [Xenorhabdus innexi]PHM38794.1 transcriptional regulator [Xenorhabdus innexi]SIP73765.1 FMN-binding negative transcriptional regulator [Xenorhabdus innexi]